MTGMYLTYIHPLETTESQRRDEKSNHSGLDVLTKSVDKLLSYSAFILTEIHGDMLFY